MKTKIFFATFTLLTFIITMVSFIPNRNKISNRAITASDTIITSQELFRLNCAGCHGINMEGKLPTFPSLINVKEKLSKEQIHTQIKNGKGLMPSLAHLSDNEIKAIVAYLFNEPNQQAITKTYSSVNVGKNIVMSNCVSCHRLTVNDPVPANTKTMCPMMEPAAFAGTTKRFKQEEFNNILETGPCYMPSFDFLTAPDKNAIWTYLKTLEGKGEPEGKTMGQMCPMMKGMKNMSKMEKMSGMENISTEKNSSTSTDTAKINTSGEYYTCSMHPEIKSNNPGTCPKCGMQLEKTTDKLGNQEKKHKMKMKCPMMN